MHASWTPAEEKQKKDPLTLYGRNLTQLALERKLELVINRDEEIRSLVRILSRKTKNNPVLVGEPGVGKTAIVEGLALKIVENQVPENLKNKQLYELNISSIVAGTSFRGQFEERVQEILKRIEESNGEIILFIDEIHMIVGAGQSGDGSMDIANMLKPMMARGQLHLIGATTLEEYRKYIEKDSALERRMQKIFIQEPSIEDTISILRGIKERYETYHEVKIKDEALVAAANLSARYISDRFLPDKAIDLIDEAASNIKTEMKYIPEPIEKLNYEIAKLEIEKAAITNSVNKNLNNNADRIKQINDSLTNLKNEHSNLINQWNHEKELLTKLSASKDNLEDLKRHLPILQSEGNYLEASKIMYVLIPQLEESQKEIENKLNSLKNRLIKETIDEEEIANIVSKWTKIPITKLLESQKTKLLNLSNNLAKRVKGQPEAIKLVSEAIKRNKVNINDPNRPIGSFLFLGPTGVGKTELAKALAANLFDNENHIIRLDMSEYMEKHSTSKLIGSPPGYIGYDDNGGQLSEKVRQNPYSIILFDEIEKAHVDVLNILLQILDDGVLSDNKGRKINFKNTIIIMTSNIGSEEIINKMPTKEEINKILLKKFKPEFINRIDEIIPFNYLDLKTIQEITQLELNKLSKRILDNTKIKLVFDKSVIEFIANKSFNVAFGARTIKRFIQNHIENQIADLILSNQNLDQAIIEITVLDDDLNIEFI
ncbi:ATP-dependent Clp protease ATP-binding subunit [Metamycoplasma alkalescens]|uniref:Chaperone ClpB n=3 Tax=Metamycoplasma alkalescens TaxID=45363 RepID=N9SQB9_9BACT|nr:AAA family ATPase [Metamycoplasma alkalescens]ENY53670.1 Chaperone ClpB [Metamycoplasma alkalescens 14918]PYF43096.1 ATP-dependent Clp protease ATP-binding subunit ClpB [Metamycoplasma alkalescens]